MKKRFGLLLAMLISASSGCATSIVRSKKHTEDYHGVYRATRADFKGIVRSFDEPIVGDWVGEMATCFLPFFILDIPISLVTDTLFLPFDLFDKKKDETNSNKSPEGTPVPGPP